MNDQIKNDTLPTVKTTTPAPVKDISELTPEMKSLFDQAAKNQGFTDIEDLATKSQERKTS